MAYIRMSADKDDIDREVKETIGEISIQIENSFRFIKVHLINQGVNADNVLVHINKNCIQQWYD